MDTNGPSTKRANATNIPAEVMCAILGHIDTGWWPLAAQSCVWWRACVFEMLRGPRVTTAIGTRTLSLAVRGGHVGVVSWLEQVSGHTLVRAHDIARWIESALPGRSWDNVIIAAARDGRDDVLVWADKHDRFIETMHHDADRSRDTPLLAAVAYGRSQAAKDLCGSPRCFTRQVYDPRIIPCAVASGDMTLLDLLGAGGFPTRPSALLLAALYPDSFVFNHICRDPRRPYGITRRLTDQATWLAHEKLWADAVRSEPCPVVGRDATDPRKPVVRLPRADDFLPGGALEHYCFTDGDHKRMAFEYYLGSLLWPLCTDPDYSRRNLDAWIERTLVEFEAWSAPRVARRRSRTMRINLADFDGDEVCKGSTMG